MRCFNRGDASATAKAFLGMPAIWGHELPSDAMWTSRVTHWRERIQAVGVRRAIAELTGN
jgi:mannitol-1-phosphate/altronate dehydrogenase